MTTVTRKSFRSRSRPSARPAISCWRFRLRAIPPTSSRRSTSRSIASRALLYTALTRLFSTLPRLDRPQALALADIAGARGAAETFDLLVTLIDLFLARLARTGTLHQTPPEAAPNETQLLARLSSTPAAARAWADLAQYLSARARRGKAVNLDPAALLMDMVLKIDETAGTLAPR